MRRAPTSILIATWLGVAVGLGLAANGLWARLSGAFVEGGWIGTAWSLIPHALGLDPGTWALTVTTLGVVWWGAFGAIWTRMPWGRPAALIAAVVSLLFFPVGTILAGAVLGLLLLPVSRAWWASVAGHDGD